ncbi:hypothetical protein FHR85_000099 [Alkalibacillus almallahensis]|nr:hypothetical protein [Alkalibacillus almallahensis]
MQVGDEMALSHAPPSAKHDDPIKEQPAYDQVVLF